MKIKLEPCRCVTFGEIAVGDTFTLNATGTDCFMKVEHHNLNAVRFNDGTLHCLHETSAVYPIYGRAMLEQEQYD